MNIELQQNEDANKLAWSAIKQQLEKIYEGRRKKPSKNNGKK